MTRVQFLMEFYKKKIIHLKSNIMGSHANRRAEFYMKKIKFVRHDIEKKLLISKKKLVINLNNNLKNMIHF